MLIFWSKRLLEVWAKGGGVVTEVKGTDSYSVNKCISIPDLLYIHIDIQ